MESGAAYQAVEAVVEGEDVYSLGLVPGEDLCLR